MVTRRTFIQNTTSLTSTAIASSLIITLPVQKNQSKEIDKGSRLDSDLVKEIVLQSHRDIEKIKALFDQEDSFLKRESAYNSWYYKRSGQSALVNASYDWGGGDFETPLAAASHMGRKDIIQLLLSKGAHFTIFAATALGKLDIVKSTLKTVPQLINIKGPHGLPLLFHANKGFEFSEKLKDEGGMDESRAVVEYIKNIL